MENENGMANSYFIRRLKGLHAIAHFQTIYSFKIDRDFIQFKYFVNNLS